MKYGGSQCLDHETGKIMYIQMGRLALIGNGRSVAIIRIRAVCRRPFLTIVLPLSWCLTPLYTLARGPVFLGPPQVVAAKRLKAG